ncbi:hypothetical protein CR105_17555 [Massilia eurypsychrophila]|uniref:Uncharacterized protein n=1 Tax=Massilia eurypsychrophila TaxID=1485217 RepID=A0A2G8TCS0_9BURK|nr:hypothetical protein CR105_17555 [Massilia eurypsychrophila]
MGDATAWASPIGVFGFSTTSPRVLVTGTRWSGSKPALVTPPERLAGQHCDRGQLHHFIAVQQQGGFAAGAGASPAVELVFGHDQQVEVE